MTDNLHETIWLAGLLEGEGSFLASSTRAKSIGSRPQARVQLKMTDPEVVAHAAYVMGVRVLGPRKQKGSHKWNDYWEAVAMSERAAEIMLRVRPYMGSRRQAQIDAVLSQDLSHHPRPVVK